MKCVQEIAILLLERMLKVSQGKKSYNIKLKINSVIFSSLFYKITYILESEYNLVLAFIQGLKDLKILLDLYASIYRAALDWLRYIL